MAQVTAKDMGGLFKAAAEAVNEGATAIERNERGTSELYNLKRLIDADAERAAVLEKLDEIQKILRGW